MTITIDFAAIRARHPLAEYCRQRGIELHKNGTSGELKGLCPLHKEKSPSFHVYPDNHYCCYGCGAHGDVTNLEQALGSGTRAEAAERLGAERGLPFNSRHHSQHARGKAGDLLFGWLKIAHESLRTGKLRVGQALAFAGPRECGKSLLQNHIITPIVGGRSAKPHR